MSDGLMIFIIFITLVILMFALQGWILLLVLGIFGMAVTITFWNCVIVGIAIAIIAGIFG